MFKLAFVTAAALLSAVPAAALTTLDFDAARGRNGVAILTRVEPRAVRVGFGSTEFDHTGRYLEVDLPGLTVASLYLPSLNGQSTTYFTVTASNAGGTSAASNIIKIVRDGNRYTCGAPS